MVRGVRARHYKSSDSILTFLPLASFSIRVINAGKSMLNEDQASCEKLFVKKPTGKNRNSTLLLEDNGVRKRERGEASKQEL